MVARLCLVVLVVVQPVLNVGAAPSCQSVPKSPAGEAAVRDEESALLQRLSSGSRRGGGCNYHCQQCNELQQENNYCSYGVGQCASPFSQISTTNMVQEVAEDIATEFARAVSNIVPFSNVIFTAISFFFPGPDQTAELAELYSQTQKYVTQQVGIAQLQNLYQEILGFQLSCMMVSQAYDIWQNTTNQTLASLYESEFNTEILALIISLNTQFYYYSCQTPWNGDGSNGYGIFFGQYVTIYMATLGQYVVAYPGDPSLQQQIDLVMLANSAITSAVTMVDNYLTLRMSYISQVKFTPAQSGYYGCTAAPQYSCSDNFESYATGGVDMTTCSWGAVAETQTRSQTSSHMWACNACPQSVTDAALQQVITCRVEHATAVMTPIIQNWNSWLLEPARQWGHMARTVCEGASYAALVKQCVALQATVNTLPSNATLEAWPAQYAAGSRIACAASYGTPIGGPVCCGQEGTGTASSAAVICGKELPICTGYTYNVAWGYCTSSAPQGTTPCPIPTPPR